MKKTWLLFLLLFLLLATGSMAQTLPTEKIFFATDRLSYGLNDTIRVTGQLVRTDHAPSAGNEAAGQLLLPYSRYLYVELLNSSDSVMVRKRLMTDEAGSFSAKMNIDPTTPKGVCYLRAYTRMMCNFSDYTIPVVPLEVFAETPTLAVTTAGMTCHFYPEGGQLVGDDMQQVAVCLTEGGNPLQTKAFLTSEQGDTLQEVVTTASGWAVFSFIPVQGRHYFLTATLGGRNQLFALPESDPQHPSLRLTKGKAQLAYDVLGTLPKGSKLYAYHQSTGLMVLPLKKKGIVVLEGIGPGVVTLMLTDRTDSIVSQSHCWHGGEKAAKTGDAGEQVFSLVRFLPLDEARQGIARSYVPTAEAMVNYQQDLFSEEPFPACYALENQADRTTDVMGWLCSARFSRFDVKKVLKEGWQAKNQPEVAPLIRGTVKGGGRQWALKEGTVVAYQRSTADAFSTEVNRDGTFVLPVGAYPDGDDFFIEAFDKKGKAGIYDYDFLGDTIPALRNHLHLWTAMADGQMENGKMKTENEVSHRGAFSFTGTNMIPEVVARAKVRVEHEQENKEYYGHRYLSEEALDKHNYQSFQEMVYHFAPYMRLIMASPERDDEGDSTDPTQEGMTELDQKTAPPEWHLFPANRISTLSGKDEIRIYVDGVLLSATQAFNLDMQQVASVEFMSPAKALPLHQGCINGCLEIKTKRFKPQSVRSMGVIYAPALGIANASQPYQPQTPEQPTEAGRYLKIVDEISVDGIRSSAKVVTFER